MGNADTLCDFLKYGYENFPAEQYCLILWNHGGGAFNGYGIDEIYYDYLTLDELDKAFSESPFTGDNKLEWIGFDACLMSSVEVAKVLSPYSNYLISSQEPEPGWGWDYKCLSGIQNCDNGLDMGKEIVDTYIECCETNFNSAWAARSDVTLSVLDLNQIDNVEMCVNNLFAKADANLSGDSYVKYSRIRANSKEVASQFTGEGSYDIVDLYNLTEGMEALYYPEANALKEALSSFIVYNKTNTYDENGVSIYYPYNATQASRYCVSMYDDFDFADSYRSYITNFCLYLNGDTTLTASWDPNTMVPYSVGQYGFALNLTAEQSQEYQTAYYVISREDLTNPENLVFVAMSTDVDMDASNTLTANYDGNIIYMQNDTTLETYEVMYTEQETTPHYTRYLISSILYNEDIQEEDAMYAYFVLEVSKEHPEGVIVGAYPIQNYVDTEGTEIFPDRYEINLDDYKYVAFGSLSHEYTSNEDLTNFNEADWADVQLTYNSMPISDGFSTVQGQMMPGINYYGMFVIEDAQGNRHVSGMIQIQ